MSDEVRSAIRAARASINDAITRRDAGAIGAFFLPSYHVVTARSMQRNGREDSVRSWAEAFARDRSVTHVGTPDEIHVNEGWGMAEEHGRWTGMLVANDGPMELAGVYAAKWQYTPEGWLLQAEIFTPITITRGSRSE
ncbi:MAG TPA: nuclear transport factor 2 family protein [Thermoanaerobaculia bacterium]|jgi:ketosteroid isomerase-like protein|nr:nuclear transport factor 2 family protein [Thermoanaerobaculia bacterium]